MTNRNSTDMKSAIKPTDFPTSVKLFLSSYLPSQRGYSNNTILSYRDTLKLLVKFIVETKKMNLAKFTFDDFTKELVIEFLENYRKNGATSTTANQRLAALKSFARYVSTDAIESMPGLVAIQNIKVRREPGRTINFLTAEQTSILINKPDIRGRTGLRHRTILTLLYDSGCRVQELCDLKVGDVFLTDGTSTVTLHGKGNKPRSVFISKQTAALLEKYSMKFLRKAAKGDPFIVNRIGEKIDRDGVAYVVQKYASLIAAGDPTFPEKVHCHMLRHSKAMHMLQAGINIVVIRDFLGHEDISTTMVYARADNRTKAEAIGKLAPKLVKDDSRPDWRQDEDLMEYLKGLK